MEDSKLITRILKLKPSQAIDLLIEVNLNATAILHEVSYSKICRINFYEEVWTGNRLSYNAANVLLTLAEIKEPKKMYNVAFYRDSTDVSNPDISFINNKKSYYNYLEKLDKEQQLIISDFEKAMEALKAGNLTTFARLFPYFKATKVKMLIVKSSNKEVNRLWRKGKKIRLSNPVLSHIDNFNPFNAETIKQLTTLKNNFKKLFL